MATNGNLLANVSNNFFRRQRTAVLNSDVVGDLLKGGIAPLESKACEPLLVGSLLRKPGSNLIHQGVDIERPGLALEKLLMRLLQFGLSSP